MTLMDIFNCIAGIASVISLLLTGYVTYKVKNIKNKLVGKVEINKICEDLDFMCREIANQMPYRPDKHNSDHILPQLNSLCSTIKSFSIFSMQTKKYSKQMKTNIKTFRRIRTNSNWDDIYYNILELKESAKIDKGRSRLEGVS